MTGYLLVPMDIQAMVINDAARQLNYRRWTYTYGSLLDFDSPEPSPWDSQSADWPSDPAVNGVYLSWNLPAAMRRGTHDAAAGATRWPLVPNRWLVVRYSGPLAGRTAAGWVVESDYLSDDDGTSPYLTPGTDNPVPTHIGRRIDLSAGTWSETGKDPLFLTAVAPGNPAFASFQPNTENVFSIHDTLTGVAAGTLAYAVLGWYSDPADDTLRTTGAQDFTDALTALGWALPEAIVADPPDACVVHGLVRGITWDPKGPIPAGGRPESGSAVCVSLANTSIDALTATVTQQTVNSGNAASYDPRLLKAFHYGLLPALDQQDGLTLLRDQVQQAGFLRSPGGLRWEIVDAHADSPAQAAAIGSQGAGDGEATWLAALNQAQAAYEACAAQLAALQWELYSMWWKYGWMQASPDAPSGVTAEQFRAALDPLATDSLLSKTAEQLATVARLQADIPHGDTPEQFQASIKAYATANHLPASRLLQPVALTSYWRQANPVMVVSGAKASEPLVPNTALACRLAADVVRAITYPAAPGGAITPAQLQVPTVQTTGMPEVLSALIDEFFMVDPDNAAAVAAQVLHDPNAAKAVAAAMADPKAMRGVPPAVGLGPWSQPWSPLFLLWELQYCPIAFAPANWAFDGHRYLWTGTGAATDGKGQFAYHAYSGYTLLTPQTVFTLRRRLERYAKDNPQAPLTQVDTFIERADHWDFLSQTLDGLNQQLTMRRPVAVVGPDAKTKVTRDLTMAQLVGDSDAYLPDPGPTDNPEGRTAFQPVRSGLAYVSGLVVVDAFGQTLELVTTSTSDEFRPVLDAEILPDKPAGSYESARMIQLRPRLTQPARLRTDFVAANDDSKIFGPDAGANPVCGWLILNHLDAALAAYAPDGTALGEMRVVTVPDPGKQSPWKKQPWWHPAPGSTWTLDAVEHAFPHLGQALGGMQGAGAAAFGDVLQMIDESLWGSVPGGLPDDQEAAVLAGRPLAVVRVRMALELNGPALTDPTWPLTFEPQSPAVLGYDFPVRIGDASRRGDGLIGYFTASNYAQFNVARMPDAVQPGFLAPIGPGNFVALRPNGAAAYLTMLADPRAPVHVISDILPVTALGIPRAFVDPAIGSMSVYFDVSPALTVLEPGPPPSVAMPVPATRDFRWSWIEPARQRPSAPPRPHRELRCPRQRPPCVPAGCSLTTCPATLGVNATMPVKIIAANTNLLAYGVSTEPDPVGISPGVTTFNIVVSNPDPRPETNPVWCEDLLIRYPAGPNAKDLTDNPSTIHVTASPATWQVSEQVEGQVRLKPSRAQDARFTTQGLLVKLSDIAVNAQVGTCVVEVQERARRGSDEFQWRTNSYQLSKFPYGWSFSDFAPKTAVVEHGNPAELTWRTYPDAEAPGVLLEMLYGTKPPVNVSGGPPFISEPLTSDTVFILRATLQIGGETVRHYQTLAVSVANPALTASALTVTGTSEFTKNATFHQGLKVDGDIGVGTPAPAYPLHLAAGKALRIEGSSGPSDSATCFSFGGTGTFSIDAPNVPGGRLVVQNSGNVGVGTNQPASRLHVNVAASGTPVDAMQIHVQSFKTIDNARASHFLRVRDVGTGADCFVIRGDGGVGIGTAETSNQKLCVQGATWLKGDLYVSGSLNYYWGPDGVWKNIQNGYDNWARSYTTSAPSDIRLKTALRPIRRALAKVRKLQGIRYRWGDTGLAHLTRDITSSVSAGPDATGEQHRQLGLAERRKAQAALAGDHIGLIAQDVEAVMPELVHEDEDGYKHIRYDLLTAVLIEAIKEQDAAVKALSAKVAGLDTRQ